MQETLEDVIKNDAALNKLLNNKEISVFSNFSKGKYDEEFKIQIQDLYYESFKEIYKKNIETNSGGVITSLLRSVKFLATKETKDLIVADLEAVLEDSYKKLNLLEKSISNNEEEMIIRILGVKEVLGPIVTNIINKFDDYDNIKEYKNKIITCCLDICDLVATVSPKKETFKYALYNMVINNLEKIKNFDSLKGRFDKHRGKISQKRTGVEIKYWIGVGVTALLILLKLLSNFS